MNSAYRAMIQGEPPEVIIGHLEKAYGVKWSTPEQMAKTIDGMRLLKWLSKDENDYTPERWALIKADWEDLKRTLSKADIHRIVIRDQILWEWARWIKGGDPAHPPERR
jgi:hypothetical protein